MPCFSVSGKSRNVLFHPTKARAMTAPERIERAREMVEQIAEMIAFADTEEAFVAAAKLDEARIALINHFVDAVNPPI